MTKIKQANISHKKRGKGYFRTTLTSKLHLCIQYTRMFPIVKQTSLLPFPPISIVTAQNPTAMMSVILQLELILL